MTLFKISRCFKFSAIAILVLRRDKISYQAYEDRKYFRRNQLRWTDRTREKNARRTSEYRISIEEDRVRQIEGKVVSFNFQTKSQKVLYYTIVHIY